MEHKQQMKGLFPLYSIDPLILIRKFYHQILLHTVGAAAYPLTGPISRYCPPSDTIPEEWVGLTKEQDHL